MKYQQRIHKAFAEFINKDAKESAKIEAEMKAAADKRKATMAAGK